LLIGVPSIDREHEELLSLLVRFSHANGARQSAEHIAEIAIRLGEQLGQHFRSEERILGSIGMPRDDVLRHVQAHREIIAKCAQLNLDLTEGKTLDLADVAQMVKVWIVDHLLAHDTKIRQYLAVPPQKGLPTSTRLSPISPAPTGRLLS
jgi:hemerythrin